jgi:hypothetical protein
MPRKPWEIPVVYNDDRFQPTSRSGQDERDSDQNERDSDDIEELLNRPSRTEEAGQLKVNSNDNRPIDYRRGPHDEELDLDDSEYISHPGPETQVESFGLDDEFESAEDDEAEFEGSL